MSEKNYTLQDIETLRSRADISYEDAQSLLDKYDGDVTRALIELEKRGELGKGLHISVNQKTTDTVKSWWRRGLETRLRVEKGETAYVDLPAIVWIVTLLLGWKAVVAGAVLALICGCRLKLVRPEAEAKTASSEEAAPEAEPEAAAPAEDADDDGYKTVSVE